MSLAPGRLLGSAVPTRAQGARGRLKKRADFIKAGRGRRVQAQAFAIQAVRREAGADGPRFGFTVTKKLGSAVLRNRIRRRLKEALRLSHLSARPDYDYVILARKAAATQAFPELQEELARAIAEIHAARPPGRANKTASAAKLKD